MIENKRIAYFKHLQETAEEVLKPIAILNGKDCFSQETINDFLTLNKKEKGWTVVGNSTHSKALKEPKIYFEWVEKDYSVKLKHPSSSDFVHAKTIWKFLKKVQDGEEIGNSLAKKTYVVTAKLFEAKSYKDFFSNSTSKKVPDVVAKPEDPLSWYLKILDTDDNAKKQICIQDAMELFPKNAMFPEEYAILMYKNENYSEAEYHFNKAIELAPNATNYLSNYGVFLHHMRWVKDFDKMERLFRKAYNLEPKHINNTGHLAYFLFDIRKSFDEAEKLFLEALKIDPENHFVASNYALMLERNRLDIPKAKKFFELAINGAPNQPIHKRNYASLLYRWNIDKNIAERILEMLTGEGAHRHDPITLEVYAGLLFMKGEKQKALLKLQKMLSYAKSEHYIESEERFLQSNAIFRFIYLPEECVSLREEIHSYFKKDWAFQGYNFSQHIKSAIANNHPFLNEVFSFAEQLSKCKYDKKGNLIYSLIDKRKPILP